MYLAEPVPADQVQYFGQTTTQEDVWTEVSPNSTITYVQGPDTGFAFNFSGEHTGTSATPLILQELD